MSPYRAPWGGYDRAEAVLTREQERAHEHALRATERWRTVRGATLTYTDVYADLVAGKYLVLVC